MAVQDDAFTESHMTTIGVDFRFRTIKVGDKTVKLQIVSRLLPCGAEAGVADSLLASVGHSGAGEIPNHHKRLLSWR